VDNFVASPQVSGKKGGSDSVSGGTATAFGSSTFGGVSHVNNSVTGSASKHSLNSLIRENGLIVTGVDNLAHNTISNNNNGHGGATGGITTGAQRRYSLRAALFNTLNSTTSESNAHYNDTSSTTTAESVDSLDHEQSNNVQHGVFLFSRMRNAIRLPGTLSNNYNSSASAHNAQNNGHTHNISNSIFTTPTKSTTGSLGGGRNLSDDAAPNTNNKDKITVKNHNLSDLMDIVITTNSNIGECFSLVCCYLLHELFTV
jgi:hypothetical protein